MRRAWPQSLQRLSREPIAKKSHTAEGASFRAKRRRPSSRSFSRPPTIRRVRKTDGAAGLVHWTVHRYEFEGGRRVDSDLSAIDPAGGRGVRSGRRPAGRQVRDGARPAPRFSRAADRHAVSNAQSLAVRRQSPRQTWTDPPYPNAGHFPAAVSVARFPSGGSSRAQVRSRNPGLFPPLRRRRKARRRLLLLVTARVFTVEDAPTRFREADETGLGEPLQRRPRGAVENLGLRRRGGEPGPLGCDGVGLGVEDEKEALGAKLGVGKARAVPRLDVLDERFLGRKRLIRTGTAAPSMACMRSMSASRPDGIVILEKSSAPSSTPSARTRFCDRR